jgi:hypothetical protein
MMPRQPAGLEGGNVKLEIGALRVSDFQCPTSNF